MIMINESVSVSGEDPSVPIMIVDDLAPVETVVDAEGKHFTFFMWLGDPVVSLIPFVFKSVLRCAIFSRLNFMVLFNMKKLKVSFSIIIQGIS